MTAYTRSRRPGRALLALFAATAALAGGTQALIPAPAAAVTDQANDCEMEQVFYFLDCEEAGNGGGGVPTAPGGGGGGEPSTDPNLEPGYGGGGGGGQGGSVSQTTPGPYDPEDAKFRQQQTENDAMKAWEKEKEEREDALRAMERKQAWEDYQRSEQVDQLISQCSFAKSVVALGRADKKDEDEILDELERRLGAGAPGQSGAVDDADLPNDCASLADQLRKILKSQAWKDLRQRQKFQKKHPKPKPKPDPLDDWPRVSPHR